MPRTIAIVQGHPDPQPVHLGHALAGAYGRGAREGGHVVRAIQVADLEFPLLRSARAWNDEPPPDGLREAGEILRTADHVALFFPLWLGTMPAVVKAFLEQTLRPGLAFHRDDPARGWRPALRGKSARVVVTMGMPSWVYRWVYLAHGVRGLERNILGFCGFKPVRETLLGGVERGGPHRHRRWLDEVYRLGVSGR